MRGKNSPGGVPGRRGRGWPAGAGLLALLAVAAPAGGADEGLFDPDAPAPAPAQEQAPVAIAKPPPAPAAAGRPAKVIANYAEQIDVPAGQSVIVRLRRPAQRVAIADPEVADVVLVSPTEILVNGRGRRWTAPTGEIIIQEAATSLIVWDKAGLADVRALYVNRSRTEQVQLHVTVAELNRTALENQGFDFRVFQDKIVFTGTPAKIANFGAFASVLTSPVPGGAKTFADVVTPAADRLTFSVIDLQNNFLAFIELLQREALAKVLARPTLLSRSGEEAHFRSGGEIPIPLVTNNQLAVQFKEFGAIVNFTPTFTAEGLIDLRVVAELSQPDPTLSPVVSGGFVVPAFRSRQASTRVRLRGGQTLLIAGLLREDELEQERKVPYVGDVPYLGWFFRTTSYEHTKSELLILVQPEVAVMTRDDSDVPVPTARPPLTRGEVRTKPTPNPVSRPRLLNRPLPAPAGEPAAEPIE